MIHVHAGTDELGRVYQPELAIVATPGAFLDAMNREILGGVIRRGRVYISNAIIDNKFALRACIVNHRTTEADVDEVIAETLTAGNEWSVGASARDC